MGTNYYHRKNICPHCKRCDKYDETHIGKSSGGWTFSFHGTYDIRSYKDWLVALREGIILDEYGEEISLDDFKALVESKKDCKLNHARESFKHRDWGQDNWLDPEGHSFSGGEFS